MVARWLRLFCACILAALGLANAAPAWAAPINFQATGLAAAGPQALLALDFVDGNAAPNSLTAGSFLSDGTLALQSQTGAVSGTLASGLLLQDSGFFNEALLALTGAGNFSFVFDATSVAPLAGGFADAFSIFLLDASTGLSLVGTDDPTGNNALLLFLIDGSGTGQLQVFAQTSALALGWSAAAAGGGGGTAPEPASWALVLLALLALAGSAGLRSQRRLQPWLPMLLAALLATGLGAAQAADLTASVQITRSGLVANRATGSFDAQVTLTNRSGVTLHGPLTLTLESASPANVALYNSYGKTASGADFIVLALPTGTLAPDASVATTVRLLTYGQAVAQTVFSVQGTRLTAANSAQIDISGVYAAGVVGPDPTPVGAGWEVAVDGVQRGSTDNAGKLKITVPVTAQTVSVSRAPSEGGSSILAALVAGSSVAATVLVEDGKEISAGSLLRFDQVQQGLLARSAARVSLRFFQAEQMVRLGALDGVSLVDILGNYSNLSALFSVQPDGSVAAAPAAFFQALAGKTGRLRLEVSGSDANGAVQAASASFYLADYRIRVQLVAPPSNPALPLAGVRLTASVLNTDLRFTAQSDGAGTLLLPDVPAGNLSLNGATALAGTSYSGVGTASITKNSLIRLTLRGPVDVLNNVPPITVLPLPAGQATGPGAVLAAAAPAAPGPLSAAQATEAAARQQLHASGLAARPAPAGKPGSNAAINAAGATSVTVTATGGVRDALAQNSAQLAVKKGTKKVTLRYTVATAEYPTYVLQQSIYNDVWSVSVLDANGASLFDITRQINSQLSQEPVWRANGSTGEIKQQIDTTALAAAADTTLIVRATSVNIGDSLLATSVSATLDSAEPLLIGNISADANPATANDGSYYSIPRPGAGNLLARSFTVELGKPSGATLTSVKVDLQNASGTALMTVLQDAAPGTADVVVEDQTDTTARLKVRATISNPASSVASQPPPSRDLTYHFVVKAKDVDGNDLSDEKDDSGKRALWRMPDGLGRYGGRDTGGDDWAARGTYDWLVTNTALVREINDISGEHGRNIGHASHGRGTDIDTYHYYRFPGAVSGGQNYDSLVADLVLAFQTLTAPPPPAASAAFNRVAAWVAASRLGLTNLTALGSVSQVIYCSGTATSGVAGGWCAGLIRTGNASRTVAGPTGPVVQTLAFGGSFNNAKMLYRNDHNDHVHITLNPSQIGE